MADRIASETELISTYLAPLAAGAPGAFGLMDDAALFAAPAGSDLVISTDPIIAGVHFFGDDQPEDIAWKALAVNVSDLAAKGAQPVAYTLALAFPESPDRAWMADFARGLATAQRAFGCHLIGGDTDRTSGPLSIGVTAIGAVPKGEFVKRQGARAGDRIFVTGTLGDAALGLKLRRGQPTCGGDIAQSGRDYLIDRYLRPAPRLAIADALRSHARAALDISDGFLKDLTRLASGLGAMFPFADLPLSPALKQAMARDADIAHCVLSGGDDYEILAAVPPDAVAGFVAMAQSAGVPLACVGGFIAGGALVITGADGKPMSVGKAGHDHFAGGE